MKASLSGWRYLWTSIDIRRKLLYTLGFLALYRVAANVPVPGVDFTALETFRANLGASGTFFNFLDLLSGGTVSQFSLLSMGVYPYITAQIILQLLTPIIPALQRRMEEDPREGQKWMEKWTYILAVPMAALRVPAGWVLERGRPIESQRSTRPDHRHADPGEQSGRGMACTRVCTI